MQSLALANSFKYGPKHFNSVRSSINFAFNSSRMGHPAKVKTLTSVEAFAELATCRKQFEMLYCIQGGQVSLSMAGEKHPSNSPFGAWMSLYFPIGKDLKLR